MGRKKKVREPVREGKDFPKEHPITKVLADEGNHWIRHALTSEWIQERDFTPYCCSAEYERYFCM